MDRQVIACARRKSLGHRASRKGAHMALKTGQGMIFEADRVAPRPSEVVRDHGINPFEGIAPLSQRGLGWHQVTLGRGERCCL